MILVREAKEPISSHKFTNFALCCSKWGVDRYGERKGVEVKRSKKDGRDNRWVVCEERKKIRRKSYIYTFTSSLSFNIYTLNVLRILNNPHN